MKMTWMVGLMLGLVGCAGLKGYKRTYSLNVTNEQGQAVGVGVTLDPVTRSGK